jgi:hypothetical protein
MHRLIPLVIAIFLAVSISPSFGTTIRKRQQKQEHRIDRGIQKGKLTPKEQSRLRNQQSVVAIERSQAMRDGKITGRERHDIRHDQNRLSKDIRHKKHNAKRVRHH